MEYDDAYFDCVRTLNVEDRLKTPSTASKSPFCLYVETHGGREKSEQWAAKYEREQGSRRAPSRFIAGVWSEQSPYSTVNSMYAQFIDVER